MHIIHIFYRPLTVNGSVCLCLCQLVLFGLSNQMVVAFKEENTDSFRHLFLRDYVDDSEEPLCIHTQRDVYDHIEYAIKQVLTRRFTFIYIYLYFYSSRMH